jgi:hypothetical protein
MEVMSGNLTANKRLGSVSLSWQKIEEYFILSLMTVQLLLPPVCLLVFIYLGKFLNPFSAYFVISIAVLLFSVYKLLTKAERSTYAIFVGFVIVQGITVVAHVVSMGASGLIEGLRTVSGFYYYWYLGFACYIVFYRTGRMETLLRWVVNVGIFISVVNLIHFYFNTVLNNYGSVKDYLEILNSNLADYLDEKEANGILRHAGYFLDTHSQFYIPLATLVIFQVERFPVKFKTLKVVIIVLATILSGVKTAYLIMLLMWLLILLRQNLKAALIMGVITIGVLACGAIILSDLVGGLVTGLVTHDFNILIDHVLKNPSTLLTGYPLVFLIGGEPDLVGVIYSEVYFITAMYYIGLVGVLLYLLPGIVFLFNRKNKYYLGAMLFVYFLFTLSHYPVYKVGVNNLVSALPVVYLLAALSDFRMGGKKAGNLKQL